MTFADQLALLMITVVIGCSTVGLAGTTCYLILQSIRKRSAEDAWGALLMLIGSIVFFFLSHVLYLHYQRSIGIQEPYTSVVSHQ
jgi:amino acid transporter